MAPIATTGSGFWVLVFELQDSDVFPNRLIRAEAHPNFRVKSGQLFVRICPRAAEWRYFFS
jgi:hypothetical protein